MDLEVPLEPGGRGEPGVVERLDGREVRPIRGDLGQHGVAAGVAEAVVLGVDAEVGRERRVVDEQAADAGLDQVVQAVVQGPAVGVGRGSRELDVGDSFAHRSSGARGLLGATRWPASAPGGVGPPRAVPGQAALAAGSPAGRGAVSRRAASTAAIVRSMSAAVIP